MFDDAATTQPANDAGVTSEPAPGGVLGPAPNTTATPATDPAAPAAGVIAPTEPINTAPAASTTADNSAFNSTPLSTANEPVIQPPDHSADSAAAPTGNDDLLGLKQQALQSLTPLLNHLDQSPEEKFKTTMMMIQASDDQSLVKSAYEAAQAITDEKEKAQALLDIVNEINYFTQLGTDKS